MPKSQANKKVMTFAFFRNDFLITLAILIGISVVAWVPFYLVESHHHAAVESQQEIVLAQNHFLQAVDGQIHVNPSTDLGRFVTDLQPELKAAEKQYKPSVTTALPASITDLQTPKGKYNDLAYQSKYYIWGGTNSGNGDFDPAAYNEGGQFSQRFLNDLNTIVAGSPSEVAAVTHQKVPNPGNTIPPIRWPLFIVWFLLIGTITYTVSAWDNEQESFFSIARAKDAPKVEAIAISVAAAPVCVPLWLAVWNESRHYRAEGKKLVKQLESPDNPLAEEVKQARAIVDKYKGSKYLHIPEVQGAFEAAQTVLDTATYAATHQKENEARKNAIDDMEALVPIAEKAAEFHSGLHQEMQEHVGTRLTEITGRFKAALGAGETPPTTGNKKTNGDDGPITPEVV